MNKESDDRLIAGRPAILVPECDNRKEEEY